MEMQFPVHPSREIPDFLRFQLDKLQKRVILHLIFDMVVVAQLVRAPGCGPGGRGFKSHLPPHFYFAYYQRLTTFDKVAEPPPKHLLSQILYRKSPYTGNFGVLLHHLVVYHTMMIQQSSERRA